MLSAVVFLSACSPVLSRQLMREGSRNVSFDRLRDAPDDYKGKMFILGGIIVNTRVTEQGALIEALYVPVDSYGYLKEGARLQGRFLAAYPGTKELLDPVIYKKGREVTLAGVFVDIRKGRIDEMDYSYPVFEIRQIYLWKEPRYYYYPPYYYPYYPYYYPYPFLYDRWGWPYGDPFWPPPPW